METINWTTEYRQRMNKIARWGEQEWYRLNHFLLYMLWGAVVLNVFYAFLILSGRISCDAPRLERILMTVTATATAAGAFLVILLKRQGVYLLLIARLMPIAELFMHTGDVAWPQVLSTLAACIFGVAFVAGSLFLTNRCEINAYDLLWPDSDSIRPVDFLEKHSKKISFSKES